MSKVVDISNVHRASRDASEWVAKLDRELSDEEHVALATWLEAHPNHLTELERHALLWDKMDVLASLAETFPHRRSARTAPLRWLSAVAAVMVVAVAGLFAFNLFESDGPSPADVTVYETAVGGLSKLALADGSDLTLNTDSRIQVRFSNAERFIRLDRGELHIEVAHEPARPLRVAVGERVLEAVGTAFSVRIHDERVEVIVTEGSVRVDEVAEAGVARQLSISQGERVFLGAERQQIESLAHEDIEDELSWRRGRIVFRGVALGEAVREVGRYTSVRFEFANPDLAKEVVGGVYKAGDVEDFLSSLEANLEIAYTRRDDESILLH